MWGDNLNDWEDVMSEETGAKGAEEGGAVEMTPEQMAQALTLEQAKTKELVDQVIALEDEVVNRVMADFDAVISDETRDFWREQIVTNRAPALVALNELANAKQSVMGGGTPGQAGAAKRPMHNRSQARPVVPSVTGGVGGETEERAAKIRNRAHEISRAERVAFSEAFRRAEREVGAAQ
jgi:hypothetical protein